MEKSYKGVFIPDRYIIDAKTKDEAALHLSNWQPSLLTAKSWIKRLDKGQVIQPSTFKQKEDGEYSHALKYWEETYFVCADGDHIKNVEFLDDGSDKNPDGIEAWTEEGQLSIKYPNLLKDVYAVGESISSMLKEPLHRRYRLIFLFDEPIRDAAHYHHILLTLAEKYPIIAPIARSPAQPVFGNGRPDSNFHICGNILSLKDYPKPVKPPQPTFEPQTNQNKQDFNETLPEYLTRHQIPYKNTDDPNKFYVDCPYSERHTGGKQGPTDSFVFDNGTAWAFYCSHAHCKNNRTWAAFKDGYGLSNGYHKQKMTAHKPEPTEPIKVQQSDEESKKVPFPEEVFTGIFDTYRTSLEGRIPIPDAFAFGTLKQIISASLGRRIHLDSQIPIYPNVYTGLIGESAEGHKGISLSVANQILKKADPNVLILTRTATEEGLIDLFNTPTFIETEDEKGMYINGIADLLPPEKVQSIIDNIDSHESIRIMGAFEEFSTILNRSKKVTFSGMTELLMELYDMPAEIITPNKTKTSKSAAFFPTFTMIGCSAFELIEQSLAQHFITAGFTNRIEWYIGEEKDPIFIYKNAHSAYWTEVINEISRLRDSYIVGQSFSFSEDAYNLGDKWNIEFTEQHKQIENILIAGSMKRMKIFTIKNALIFAALEHRGDNIIHEADMIKALQLSEYNCTVVEKLFGSFTKSEHQRVCNRIIEILKKSPMLSAKQIQNNMKWADIKDIDLAIDLMIKMQIIAANCPKKTQLFYVPAEN